MKQRRFVATLPVVAKRKTLKHKRNREERLQIGDRIRQLWEDAVPKRQEWWYAKQLGISTRQYQNLKVIGTQKWEHIEKLAKIHGVDPVWLQTGQDRPQLARSVAKGFGDQLDRIEDLVERVLDVLEPVSAALHVAGGVPDSHQASRRDASQASATNSPKASRRKRASG